MHSTEHHDLMLDLRFSQNVIKFLHFWKVEIFDATNGHVTELHRRRWHDAFGKPSTGANYSRSAVTTAGGNGNGRARCAGKARKENPSIINRQPRVHVTPHRIDGVNRRLQRSV